MSIHLDLLSKYEDAEDRLHKAKVNLIMSVKGKTFYKVGDLSNTKWKGSSVNVYDKEVILTYSDLRIVVSVEELSEQFSVHKYGEGDNNNPVKFKRTIMGSIVRPESVKSIVRYMREKYNY